MAIELRLPNIKGNDREQLAQIRSYLYQLAEQLQWALNNVNTSAVNYVVQQVPSGTSSYSQVAPMNLDDEGDFDALKPLIIKSADIKVSKSLNATGWYKVGTLSGEMCAVATLTVGGIFVNNQASPSMVDIATQYNQARTFLRLPSLADNQIAKIGVVKESAKVYGVYAYYNTSNENTVSINIHIHMGTFESADLAVSSVVESNMLTVVTLKA